MKLNKNLKNNFFGIYEKALPPVSIEEKLKIASKLKFDFVEMSIDETEERLNRLNWSDDQIGKILKICLENDIFIRSICLSGHRKYPLGSHDEKIRTKSLEIMEKCIILAHKLNVKIIQIAGYDVFYEKKDNLTKKYFIENLNKSLILANKYGINLAIEIMDDPFINSITKFLAIKKQCPSPWLSVYPDLGNLTAWNIDNVIYELEIGFTNIVALHIKDTLAVTKNFKGKFKNVNFGEGCVNFEKIFKYLLQKNYTGSFLIEAWYEDFDEPIEKLKNAKKYILNIFSKVGWEMC